MKGDDGLGGRPVAGWDGLAVSRGCLRAVADQERVHRVQVERPDRLVGEHLRRGARPPKSGTRPVEMGDMSTTGRRMPRWKTLTSNWRPPDAPYVSALGYPSAASRLSLGCLSAVSRLPLGTLTPVPHHAPPKSRYCSIVSIQ